MKKYTKLVLVFSLLFRGSTVAQTDLTGTWQGKLAVRPNEIIQFAITKQWNGSYTALFISPHNINPSTAVKFDGGKLIIDVASLRSSYSGTVGNDTITGEWRQQTSILPLVLTLQRPDVGVLKPLFGEWYGTTWLEGAGRRVIAFRFGTTREGKFAAFMDFPGTPVMGKSVIDVSLARNEVTWKAPEIGIDLAGQLSGNSIRGVNKNGKYEVNLIKGKYQPGIFDMPPEEIRRLAGQWVGKWDVPGETVYSILLRFEKTKDGKLEASLNIPLQGQQLVAALEDVSLKADQLSFWVPKMWNGDNTEYAGKLNKDSISGTFTFRGKRYPINLTRGAKIEVPVTQVNIPANKMKKLLGRWSGEASPVYFVLRFERNADGKYVAFIDDAKTNSKTYKGLMVIQASMNGDDLSLKTPFRGPEINGKLNFFGNRINGTVKVMEADAPPRYLTTPFSLTKQ